MRPDNKTIETRLQQLREEMRREHLSAFIFPSADPHLSEYVPERWEGRKWISGFDGSAGTAVVTLHGAALWTDSRYFLAAEEQLDGTEFTLMRERVEGTPSIAEWIGSQTEDADDKEVGVDGMCISLGEAEALKDELKHNGGICLRTNLDILSRIWTDRPSVPLNPVEIQPLEYAGETAADKLSRIRHELLRKGASGMLLTQLDDIAWTLNLRGTDVHCTPVFVAWLIIAEETAVLYVKDDKLSVEVMAYLREQGVMVDDYDNIIEGLNSYDAYTLLIDPATVNCTLAKARGNFNPVFAPSPVPAMKAVKNETERNGFRHAMERDGVAMVRFLKLNVQIVECTTIREADGLAKSSRNTLLSADERAIAPRIYEALQSSREYAKTHTLAETHEYVVSTINAVDGLEVEYFSIVDGDTLLDVANWDDSAYVVGCITVYCGKTPIRLIDHITYKK